MTISWSAATIVIVAASLLHCCNGLTVGLGFAKAAKKGRTISVQPPTTHIRFCCAQRDDDGPHQYPDQRKPEYRSISDYMGGHHAGKFDFDPRICGVTALNYEKSVVFDSDATMTTNLVAPLEDTLLVPQWATRPVDLEQILCSTNNDGAIRVGGPDVMLTNEEISWEPFYATIVEATTGVDGASLLEVSPTNGTMAPRGGSDPYTDQVRFTVSQTNNDNDNLSDNHHSLFLVVRTELDAWSWRIVVND